MSGAIQNLLGVDKNSADYIRKKYWIKYGATVVGLKKIHNINRDTYSNDNLFFSHRRATHKGQKTTGRLINLISLT